MIADQIGSNLHLDELAVRPDCMRQGLGRALVELGCTEARKRECAGVTLRTFAEVPWNGPFYQKLGFRELPHNEVPSALWEFIGDEEARGLNISRRIFMHRKP